MDGIALLPNPYVEALTPRVTVSGDGASNEAKWNC